MMTRLRARELADLDQQVRKLLALDQSSRITGWAVFDGDKLVAHGKISVDDPDIGERLYKIKTQVMELIDKYEITEIVFEDIQLQTNVVQNVRTFKVLAEVFGVLYETFTELEIPNEAVLAASWKSTLGIRGADRATQKRNAAEYVANTYNIKATQDECDAICIGTHYIKTNPESFDWS
jgi:Holliday junction resolvasome RuvABC endonuclease subunit